MRQIAATDVVVATRYHNVVCALKLGKPTVSVGYAEKNDVLMAEMGLGGFCQHVERLDLDRLIEQFTQLVADRQRYEPGIRKANLACQERLDRQDSLPGSMPPLMPWLDHRGRRQKAPLSQHRHDHRADAPRWWLPSVIG